MNNSEYVCFYVYWDCKFDGAMRYADVLAPSSSALRLMSCCCEEFASNCGLRFTASKTQPILDCLPCCIHPVFIFVVNNFLFLILSLISVIFFTIYDLSDAPDILDKLCSMVRKANCLFASFPRIVFSLVYFSLITILSTVPIFGHCPFPHFAILI